MERSGPFAGSANIRLGGDLEGGGDSRALNAGPESEALDARAGSYVPNAFLGDFFFLGGGPAAGAVLFSFLLNLEKTCCV